MPQPIQGVEPPSVVEFFSFYCPHCFAFLQQYGIGSGIRDVLLSGKKGQIPCGFPGDTGSANHRCLGYGTGEEG
ncbi:Thiol:disulfide interchange protein DsbA precursor [Escherichia coli]|nr:Thiol:disulfide interchange protein DsbA precursor [Escherichia coli]